MDLQAANLQARYRYIENSAGTVTTRQGQDSGVLRARLKFDSAGNYAVTAHVATGDGFLGGWNNMGPGTGDASYAWFLKQLFVTASPLKGIAFSYGGFAPLRGESTEITTWDNDGTLVGERAVIRRPKDLYVDDLSLTLGYLGDTTTSNVFTKAKRLDEVNYGHVLAAKRFGPAVAASADYTRLAGTNTLRAALSVRISRPFVDLLRYEQYRRFDGPGAFGFAAYGEKTVTKRLVLGAGVADIDKAYGGLNGDRYNRGRRAFQQGTYTVTRELSVSVFATEAFHNDFPVSNTQRYEALVAYNALATLRRYGLVH